MTPITRIRILHTAIWIFYNIIIFYLFFAVVTDRIGIRVWICIGLVVAEGLVLLLFKTICPVTIMARKYSTSTKANFDIFLPLWLAKHNKLIYTSIFIVTMIILIYKLSHQV